MWENEARPNGAGNTLRPLTRSSDLTREGLALKATPTATHGARSPRWMGHPRKYQAAAQEVYIAEHRRVVLPWSWITLSCDEPMCLNVECMTLHESQKIHYPAGVCVYCGDPAGQRDHLIPMPLSGAALRLRVLTVPSCANCNNRINDFPSFCVTERRERAHASIHKNNRALLERPIKNAAEMRELGPSLRSVAVKNNRKAEWLKGRLSWPDDPYYDLRAFQRSGIEDPVALGLVAGIDCRRTA